MVILFVTTFTGCELFTTRNPESPEQSNQNFLPATSTDIVIENFKNSIKYKSLDNYINCFVSPNPKRNFYFRPTNEAKVLNSSIFDNWDISSERSYFNSMVSSLAKDYIPKLIFTNTKYDFSSADSVVFIANYSLLLENLSVNLNSDYTGLLQFTIVPTGSGLWAIQSWYDTKVKNDSSKVTWSDLKVQFYN